MKPSRVWNVCDAVFSGLVTHSTRRRPWDRASAKNVDGAADTLTVQRRIDGGELVACAGVRKADG